MKKFFKTCFSVTSILLSLLALSSCEKEESTGSEASSNPRVDVIAPEKGASNEVLTITGSGIGGITSVMFETDSVTASFNPNFNTESALIFRIPVDAVPGEQDIIFRNSKGIEFKASFNVLGLPTVQTVSNYNYMPGTDITLTGKNLADVSKVVFQGQAQEVEVVAKTATSLTLKMPATALAQTKLDITNEAGTVTTTQEFVNVENAFLIFNEDYQNGFVNGSWGPAEVSSTVAKSGTKSFKVTYVKGNWSANGFANWDPGVAFSPDYKFLSFWVKGGVETQTFYITGDQRAGGYGNSDRTAPIVVPANEWTYFKIKLSDLELWKKGGAFKQLGFWIPGPDNQDEVLYFDDVIFIK